MDQPATDTRLSGETPVTLPLRAVERALAIWQGQGDPRIWRAFFIAGLISICAITAFTGAVPTRRYGHDLFFLLGNAWRVMNGQRPHLDFSSFSGPLTFLIPALGLGVSGNSVNGIGYGNAIFGLLIGLWSYGVTRGRMEAGPRLLASFFLVGLVVAPYPVGESPFLSNHAMVYNRYGYGLIGIILLEAFQPTEDREPDDKNWIAGFSSGAALAMLLFLKANYFLVAAVLIGVSMLFRPSWKRTIGVTLGLLTVSFLFISYLRFDIAAMLRDLRTAAEARSKLATAGPDKGVLLLYEKTNLLLVLTLAGLNYMEEKVSGSTRMGSYLVLAGCLIFGGDILIRATNHQSRGLPLLAIFALILTNNFTARRRQIPVPAARASLAGHVAILALAGMLFLPLFASDMIGIAYGASQKARPSHPELAGRFTEPRLAPLLLYDNDMSGLASSNGRPYTTSINDGIALLRRASAPSETVFTLDMANPFPYALGRKPAFGGPNGVGWGPLSDKLYLSADEFFGKADIVMVPKNPGLTPEEFSGPYRVHEEALRQLFRLDAETDWWLLYRRR
jgi:hypothetical protein